LRSPHEQKVISTTGSSQLRRSKPPTGFPGMSNFLDELVQLSRRARSALVVRVMYGTPLVDEERFALDLSHGRF
jgi:hypothetical protein